MSAEVRRSSSKIISSNRLRASVRHLGYGAGDAAEEPPLQFPSTRSSRPPLHAPDDANSASSEFTAKAAIRQKTLSELMDNVSPEYAAEVRKRLRTLSTRRRTTAAAEAMKGAGEAEVDFELYDCAKKTDARAPLSAAISSCTMSTATLTTMTTSTGFSSAYGYDCGSVGRMWTPSSVHPKSSTAKQSSTRQDLVADIETGGTFAGFDVEKSRSPPPSMTTSALRPSHSLAVGSEQKLWDGETLIRSISPPSPPLGMDFPLPTTALIRGALSGGATSLSRGCSSSAADMTTEERKADRRLASEGEAGRGVGSSVANEEEETMRCAAVVGGAAARGGEELEPTSPAPTLWALSKTVRWAKLLMGSRKEDSCEPPFEVLSCTPDSGTYCPITSSLSPLTLSEGDGDLDPPELRGLELPNGLKGLDLSDRSVRHFLLPWRKEPSPQQGRGARRLSGDKCTMTSLSPSLLVNFPVNGRHPCEGDSEGERTEHRSESSVRGSTDDVEEPSGLIVRFPDRGLRQSGRPNRRASAPSRLTGEGVSDAGRCDRETRWSIGGGDFGNCSYPPVEFHQETHRRGRGNVGLDSSPLLVDFPKSCRRELGGEGSSTTSANKSKDNLTWNCFRGGELAAEPIMLKECASKPSDYRFQRREDSDVYKGRKAEEQRNRQKKVEGKICDLQFLPYF